MSVQKTLKLLFGEPETPWMEDDSSFEQNTRSKKDYEARKLRIKHGLKALNYLNEHKLLDEKDYHEMLTLICSNFVNNEIEDRVARAFGRMNPSLF